MKIILSTRNPSKARQIKAFSRDPSIILLTLDDMGIEGEAVEDGDTLAENALKKALYARSKTNEKHWVMAEDTGLFIKGLGGEPGIKAARWAGEEATTEEITQYCLKSMKDLSDRSAFFETIAVLLSPENKEYFFSGKLHGTLLDYPKTKPLPKMPYSPIFLPVGRDKVLGEMTVEEGNVISHRGKAMKKLFGFLKSV